MSEPDNIYTWISNIIDSCENPSHIEPCKILISFYEKNGATEYLVNALRVSLQFKVAAIHEKSLLAQQEKEEDRVWRMFEMGKYTQKEISDKTGVKILEVQKIITKKMR